MHAAEDIYGLWTTEKVAPVRTSFTPLPTHVIHMLKNRKNPRKKNPLCFQRRSFERAKISKPA